MNILKNNKGGPIGRFYCCSNDSSFRELTTHVQLP